MGSRIFLFGATLLVATSFTTLPAGSASVGEDPHCGALQAQQLQLTRQVKLLKSDIIYWDKTIPEYQQAIKSLEDEAVAAGQSRTGNVTNETRYYKDKIASAQQDLRVKSGQERVAVQKLLYVEGRQKVYNCVLSFDLSGEWTLTWTWSVTSVDFVGMVGGSAGHWTFTGTLAGGGNAVWSPRKGSGTVNCTLSGKMGTQGTIECSAAFTDPTPAEWTGTASGALDTMQSRGKRNFEFTGRNGHGTSTGQPPAGIDLLQLQPKD